MTTGTTERAEESWVERMGKEELRRTSCERALHILQRSSSIWGGGERGRVREGRGRKGGEGEGESKRGERKRGERGRGRESGGGEGGGERKRGSKDTVCVAEATVMQ